MDTDTLMQKLMQKYPLVSREELDELRAASHYPAFCKAGFKSKVSGLHRERENEKLHGRESVHAGPLMQVISVKYIPNNDIDQNRPSTIYGRIYAKFRNPSGNLVIKDFYNRKRDDAEVLEPNGFLTLMASPDTCYWHFNARLEHTKIVVDVYVGDHNISAKFVCGNGLIDQEQTRLEHIRGDFSSLELCFNVIPFANYGFVRVAFTPKESHTQAGNYLSLKVYGKVVARSSNKSFEGYTLFDKKSHEYEEVQFNWALGVLDMFRGVGVSADSSLIFDINLFEYGTNSIIFRESVETKIEIMASAHSFSGTGHILRNVLEVIWHPPFGQGWCIIERPGMSLDNSSDREMSSSSEETSEEESDDDDEMGEVSIPDVSSNFSLSWPLLVHRDIPLSSGAFQIFSIFIGRENLKAVQIYGSINVLSRSLTCQVFNKEASEAFVLEKGVKIMPLVLCSSGGYDDSETLNMNFDLKDVNNVLHIRGRVHVHWSSIKSLWNDRLLCSVIQGDHGFAAIHYALFSEAVQAKVGVVCRPKHGQVDFSPKVFGSLVAYYGKYNYPSSSYNKRYFRIPLFARTQEDPAQVGDKGVISLSRPVVVVPDGSSLIVKANLYLSDGVCSQSFLCSREMRMGNREPYIMDGDYCSIHVDVKWEEVGN